MNTPGDQQHAQYRSKMNIPLFLLFFLCCQKCCSPVNAADSHYNLMDDNPIFRECVTPEDKKGYCVEIYYCLPLLQSMNETAINERKCGPSNENRKKPEVCCEPNLIQLISVVTQPTSPAPMSCGVQNISTPTRIWGGEEALPGEFPWMARLLRQNHNGDYTFSCSGALVSPKVVLTSAHCLLSPKLESLGSLAAVTLGEHEAECGFGNVKCLLHKKTAMVAETISHDNYKINTKNHDNDVGLIILEEKVTFTDFILPICILEKPYEAPFYFISGWGVTENGGMSNVKLKTTLPPFSWDQCVDKYKNISVTVTTHQLCAGGVKGEDSCQGDSGGPLMVNKDGRWFAAGLVSFGLGCGNEGWPGVYTNLPTYSSWIKTKMNKIA